MGRPPGSRQLWQPEELPAFMQCLKQEHPDGFVPDPNWFKAFVAKAILFRTAQAVVRDAKFPAYRANIVAYTVAALSWRVGGRMDFDLVWSKQSLSPELKALLRNWAGQVDNALRETSGSRMPSEWAKKVECRDALREVDFPLPDVLPPELAAQTTLSGASTARTIRQTTVSIAKISSALTPCARFLPRLGCAWLSGERRRR